LLISSLLIFVYWETKECEDNLRRKGAIEEHPKTVSGRELDPRRPKKFIILLLLYFSDFL
jgi:hypothetical protein